MLSQVSTSASTSTLLERKIDETTAGLQASFGKLLHSINESNAAIIVEYVAALKTEVNLADSYRRDVIVLLCRLSTYHDNNKSFKDLTRTDVLEFLDSFRKTCRRIARSEIINTNLLLVYMTGKTTRNF